MLPFTLFGGQDRGSVPTFRRLHSCPALRGCLFAVPLNAKRRGSPHEEGIHAGRSALSAYASSLRQARAARAPGGSYSPSGIRPKPVCGQYSRKIIYPVTRENAEQLIQRAIAAGLSFDVGKMQINSWWMERYGIDPLSLLDPATNERWGKWILVEEIARHGLSWKAVGKYHSPTLNRTGIMHGSFIVTQAQEPPRFRRPSCE